MDQRTDAELVAAARGGELRAFEELVRRHQSFVFGAAYRVTQNRALAEDVTQETFFRAWRKLDGFRGEAQVRSWLYRIATNIALNAVTRSRESASEAPIQAADTGTPERAMVETATRHALAAVVADLPEDLRKPYVLREFEERSYEEIARALDIPLNTTRTRIHRARKAVAHSMEGWK